MNNYNLLLIGWKIKLKFSELETYKLIFKQINETDKKEYLIEKFKRGEYDSKYPFGLFLDSDQIYYVKSKDILKNEVILIDQDFGEISKLQVKQKIKNSGIISLLKTYLDTILVESGYIKPYQSRGCLGKYSKGVLSKKSERIRLTKEETGLEKDYYISPAENFDFIFVNPDEIIITYLPRFIVFDNGFSLPQSPLIQKKIQTTKKWQETVYLDYERYYKRFREIDKLIKNKFKQWNFITSFNNLEKLRFHMLDRPNSIKFEKRIIEIKKDLKFQDQIKALIKLIAITFRIKIFIETPILQDPLVQEFIIELKKRKIICLDPTSEFDRSSFDGNQDFKSETDTLLILLNYNNQKNEYYYNLLKSNLKIPNKVINFESIKNKKDDWENIIDSIILSLYSRREETALYDIPLDTYERIYSFYYIMDFNYEINILFYGIYNLKSNKFEFKSELLPWNTSKEGLINKIKEIQIDEKKSCIILEKNTLIARMIKKYLRTCNADIIILKKLNGRIFEFDNENLVTLHNGTFIKLSNNKFLIITTGEPEYDFKFDKKEIFKLGGLPNPLYLKLFLKNSNFANALKSIYYQSFINLETTSKNLYPFILHYVLNMQYYYNLRKNQIILEELIVNYEEV